MADGRYAIGTRLAIVAGLFALVAVPACMSGIAWRRGRDPSLVLVTGYCNCGKCCGWNSDDSETGEPVYSYGPMKGKSKVVGRTATGTVAGTGTIAADPKVYRFGTRLYVPGYGTGTVEDVGGSIKGKHVDVWFPDHASARRWGSRWLKVEPVK